MKILLSNDDGYDAPGLLALHEALSGIAEVTVVAPESNQSGCSSKLSLRQPIKVRTHENGFMSVDGTPADCVHLAITGMLDFQPDLVISGINNGPNMGDDVIYSGTVAAAIEGRFLPLPGIAISLAGYKLNHYDAAARVIVELLARINSSQIANNSLLNINVPDLPYEQIRGFAVTRLGVRHQSAPVINEGRVDGFDIYRIGPPGARQDAPDPGPDTISATDFQAIENNKVSITPLTVDMTAYKNITDMGEWLAASGAKQYG